MSFGAIRSSRPVASLGEASWVGSGPDPRIIQVFTYKENRVLFLEEGGPLAFPCDVTVTVMLAPSPVHGDYVPGSTCRLGSQAGLTWNANTGRNVTLSTPPLDPTDVRATVGDLKFAINGHTVEAAWHCGSRNDLLGVLGALHFVLPLSIGVAFADPAIPIVTSGRAGDTKFVWQVESTGTAFETLGAVDRDERVLAALARLPVLCARRNVRLLASLAYLDKAVRLLTTGFGPSDFAAEAVLNLAKCIEVLFPGPPEMSREAARAGLAALGYSDDEIEQTFVKALVLRSRLDAAHVRLATLNAAERRKVQMYMEGVIDRFRALLRDMIDRASRDDLDLAPYEHDRSPGDELARILDSIADTVTGPSDTSRAASN